MSALREKVARIVQDAVNAALAGGDLEQGDWTDSLPEAADILAAVRERLMEPSEAMLEAAAGRAYFRDLDLRQAWRVMLEAAFAAPEP